MDRRSFSVVICTHRRPELLRRSIASVLAQDYPTDRYELIVVDNAADETTADLVRAVAVEAPVAVTYVVERQPGVSAARNRGIAEARFDYVAFLDDDATAHPDWLAAFDAVIREHHAMVVGGKTIPVPATGAAVPPWFASPFVRGLFGAYRMPGREPVARMRYPDSQLGGGNSAYARRLFRHFGGFPTAHGRTTRSLRSGEETYLNYILDRHDIPIYLTQHARIDHVVDVDRLTKGHIRRRTFWNTVSGAEIQVQVFGRWPVWRATAWPTARALLRSIRKLVRARGEVDRLTRECQVLGNAGFLIGLASGSVRRRPDDRAAISWGPREWIEEVAGWPEGIDKHRRLYELSSALGDEAGAQAALDRLVAYLEELPASPELPGERRSGERAT